MIQLVKNTNNIENTTNKHISQLNTDLEYVLELEKNSGRIGRKGVLFSNRQENCVIIFMNCSAILIRQMTLSSLRIWKKI